MRRAETRMKDAENSYQNRRYEMNKWKRILALAPMVFSMSAFGEIEIHQAIELSIPTDTNSSYQIRTSSNLVDWVDSGYPFNGNGGTNSHFFSTFDKTKEFYRVVKTTPSNLTEIDLLSYLNPIGVWVYDSYEGGVGAAANWTLRSLGTASKNGEPVIIKQEYDNTGYLSDRQFISTDFSKRCQETGGYDQGQGDWYWSKPVPIILPQFIPGQTNYFSGYTRTDMIGVFDVYLVMTNEQVIVPAGTYDTIRVTSIYEALPPSPIAGTYVFKAWYAKNIGLVKRVQEDGTMWELKRYNNYTP
jgi:hypothetical protein